MLEKKKTITAENYVPQTGPNLSWPHACICMWLISSLLRRFAFASINKPRPHVRLITKIHTYSTRTREQINTKPALPSKCKLECLSSTSRATPFSIAAACQSIDRSPSNQRIKTRSRTVAPAPACTRCLERTTLVRATDRPLHRD